MKKLLSAVWFMAMAVTLYAEVPNEINYQGRLREYGQPITANRTMNFKIYAIEAGGVPVWSSGDVVVAVTTGTFGYAMQPSGVDWRWKDFWVETTVSGKILSPREKIGAGVYALHSRTAEGITKTSGTVTVTIGSIAELAVTTFTVSVEFNRLVNVSTPTAYDDGATKGYVDGLIGGSEGAVNLSASTQTKTGGLNTGGTISSPRMQAAMNVSVGNAVFLSSGSSSFSGAVNVSTPAAFDNAASKGYVDNLVSASGDVVVGNEVTDAANATLTRSGAGTAGDPYKLALNTGYANTWSGAQTYGAVTNFRQKIVVGTTTANINTYAHIENDSNDNSPYEILTLRRSRSDAVAPGAADFGTDIVFRLEGWSNNSDALAARIRSGWESAQNNDSTDRDSYISFATMADGNAVTEKLRIASSGVTVTTPTAYDNVASKGYVDTWLPSGTILMWGGTQASIPTGWLLCDGGAVSRTTYARLFAAIGTVHGVGDGVTTFNLPPLQDRFIVGAGSSYNVKDIGGAGTVTLAVTEMPAHNHGGGTGTAGAHAHSYDRASSGIADTTGGPNNAEYDTYSIVNTSTNGDHSHTISNQGGGLGHENRPPYYALCYIIKN